MKLTKLLFEDLLAKNNHIHYRPNGKPPVCGAGEEGDRVEGTNDPKAVNCESCLEKMK